MRKCLSGQIEKQCILENDRINRYLINKFKLLNCLFFFKNPISKLICLGSTVCGD